MALIKHSVVGGRGGARKRVLEWEQRNDRAGEDLLND